MVIDSIAKAQEAKGCTYVSGSVEIQIRGGSEYENDVGYFWLCANYCFRPTVLLNS